MSTKDDFRAYINPQPALSEAAQKAMLESISSPTIYVEGRNESRAAWINSMRAGSVAVVPELFVLAKATGSKDRRFADLLKVKDEIHDLGAYILEVSSGRKSNDRKQWPLMRDRAYAMFNGAVRAKRAGRSRLGYTDRQLEAIKAIVDSKHYRNWGERAEAMEARGIKPVPGRSWCYSELPKLTDKLGAVVELVPVEPKFKRAPSRKKLAGQVYFVRDGEAVKIGWSINPTERVAGFGTSNHRDLELLATMPGGMSLEKELHKRFAALRLKGEWFRYGPDIAKFIASIVRKKPSDRQKAK